MWLRSLPTEMKSPRYDQSWMVFIRACCRVVETYDWVKGRREDSELRFFSVSLSLRWQECSYPLDKGRSLLTQTYEELWCTRVEGRQGDLPTPAGFLRCLQLHKSNIPRCVLGVVCPEWDMLTTADTYIISIVWAFAIITGCSCDPNQTNDTWFQISGASAREASSKG